MKFYTYEDVKNLKKGTTYIMLLMVLDGKYIGLALNDKSHLIKPRCFNIESYDFIVCTRVISTKGDYYIPIGYSNEHEWLDQECEYMMKEFV